MSSDCSLTTCLSDCNDFMQIQVNRSYREDSSFILVIITVTRLPVHVPVLHFIILRRLPASVSHRAIWEKERRKCLGRQRKQDSSEDINNKSLFLSLYLFSKQDVLHIHTHHQEPQDPRLPTASACLIQQVRLSTIPEDCSKLLV